MSSQPATDPRRVVIVDDTVDLRDLLRLAFSRGGFDVVAEAGDGREAIEVVRRERPDIVLLDLSMPVMDGLEALPSIRMLVPSATVVVLSGFGATQMSARAMANGADGYIQKGAPLGTILDYVRELDADGGRAREPLDVAHLAGDTVPTAIAEDLHVEPASHRLVGPPTAQRGQVEVPPPPVDDASSWEALQMAPFGVVELADEPLFRVVFANSQAQRLLGHRARQGAPLSLASGDLASLVAFHRLDPDATFPVELEGGAVRATVRRTGWSLVVYLDSTADDVSMLRRAIATTAHEIRGPVAVICGVAETLSMLDDPADRERLMASVARQARILDSITADLLTAAQIQRGTLRIDLKRVQPRAVIAAVVSDRFEVTVTIDDERPVRADPLRMEQMLSNLLTNAYKYGAPPFKVRVRSDGDLVCIDVVDAGEGVPEEFRHKLFREFSRADDAVATGTGLGLYVTRTLAEAMNGTVSYQPGPYGGSVFTISLLAASTVDVEGDVPPDLRAASPWIEPDRLDAAEGRA